MMTFFVFFRFFIHFATKSLFYFLKSFKINLTTFFWIFKFFMANFKVVKWKTIHLCVSWVCVCLIQEFNHKKHLHNCYCLLFASHVFSAAIFFYYTEHFTWNYNHYLYVKLWQIVPFFSKVVVIREAHPIIKMLQLMSIIIYKHRYFYINLSKPRTCLILLFY